MCISFPDSRRRKFSQDSVEEEEAAFKIARQLAGLQEKGVLTCFIEGMACFSSHAVVQEQGCAALKKIAYDTKFQVSIADAGGVELVVAIGGRCTTQPCETHWDSAFWLWGTV